MLLRGPAFRYGTISDDEAIYDTMAQEILAGGVLYKHTVDHKPPGLVYTYAAIESLSGNGRHRLAFVHYFGLLVAIGTCFGLYFVSRQILAPPLEVVPPLLYAVTSTTKVPYDALAINGELLMNLPIILGVGCSLLANDKHTSRALGLDVLSGLCIAVAFLCKFQAGVLLCALPFIALDSEGWRWRSRVLAWSVGFCIPIAGLALYFYRAGALRDAAHWGVAFNAQYIRSGVSAAWATQRLARQCIGVILPGLLLYASAALTLVRLVRRDNRVADIRRYRVFLVVWSLLSLLAVAIGGRYFGHYFLQPELPLAIAAAGPAARLFSTKRWVFASLLVVPALVFSLGAALPSTPGRWLDDDMIDYERLGSELAARTNTGDSIWIWGNVPRLYYSANRRSGTRFTFCNYLTGNRQGRPPSMTYGSTHQNEVNHKHGLRSSVILGSGGHALSWTRLPPTGSHTKSFQSNAIRNSPGTSPSTIGVAVTLMEPSSMIGSDDVAKAHAGDIAPVHVGLCARLLAKMLSSPNVSGR